MKSISWPGVIRSYWLTILVTALTTCLASLLVVIASSPSYTSELQMYVSAQVGGDTQGAYQGAQLSEQRVKSYSELAQSFRVAEAVRGILNLPQSVEDIQRQISATSVLNSVLLNIQVTDSSPEEAARIANTVGVVLPRVVAEAERPNRPSQSLPVELRVVDQAQVPTEPSSWSATSVALLSLGLGTALGIIISYGRERADDKVRTVEELKIVTGESVLGMVPEQDGVSSANAAKPEIANSPFAESVRSIRTNIRFLDVDRPPQFLGVCSTKSGDGVSSLCLGLAAAFSRSGYRVLLIQGGSPDSSAQASMGLSEVLQGAADLGQAIISASDDGVAVLPAGLDDGSKAELLGSARFEQIQQFLRHRYDLVLLDCPAVTSGPDALILARKLDGIVILCRAGSTRAEELKSAQDCLQSAGGRVLGSILYRTPRSGRFGYEYYSTYYAPHHRESDRSVEGKARA